MLDPSLYTWAGIGTLVVGLYAALQYLNKELNALEDATINAAEHAILKAASGSKGLTALVTGANSGIGLSLATKLARCGVKVYLGCRNKGRGSAAVEQIKSVVGDHAEVYLLQMDVSSPASVCAAAERLRGLEGKLDLLYLNAGILPVARHNWCIMLHSLLTCSLRYYFETGRATENGTHFLVQPTWGHDYMWSNPAAGGAPLMLATHVLGHALLVEELLPLLKKGKIGRTAGRVVWTGSRASSRAQTLWSALAVPSSDTVYSRQDGKKPSTPNPLAHTESYGEAKFVQDALNPPLAQALQRFNIPSVVVCPGGVDTEMTPFLLTLFKPLLTHFRPFLPGMNFTTTRGSAVHLFVAAVEGGSLSPVVKHVMAVGGLGRAVNGAPAVTMEDAQQAWGTVTEWIERWREMVDVHPAEENVLWG